MNTALFLPEQKDGITTFHVRGYLNEESVFPRLEPNESQLILLDCERLEGLNSVAVANWIRWIGAVAAHTEIRLRYCQRQLIDSITTVPQMLPGNSRIESFYVPYFCAGCGKVNHLFFNTDDLIQDLKMKKPLPVPGEIQCKKCLESAAIDVIGKLYFSFLQKKQ